MITQLEAVNVGPFDHTGVSLDLKPLTIIIGPNNVGKSSLIYAYDIVANSRFPALHIRTFENLESFIYMKDPLNLGKISVNYVGAKNSNVHIVANININKQPKFEYYVNGKAPTNQNSEEERQDYPEAHLFLQRTTYLLSNRSFVSPSIGINIRDESEADALNSAGSNIIQFLLFKWTNRDPNWQDAEYWLKKIDPYLNILKAPLKAGRASLITERQFESKSLDVNVALQGSGIQRALQIISALVFTPKNSCIIIEEPEMNLHPKAQEVIADLINKAVNEWGKQVIFTTHSLNMLLPYASDMGFATERSKKEHIIADKEKVALCVLEYKDGTVSARNDVKYSKFTEFKIDMKKIWG